MSVVVIDPHEIRSMIATEIRAALAERAADAVVVHDWLDAKGAATLLAVHPRTVAKLAKSGALPASRVGKLLRFRRADVVAFLDRNAGR